MTAPVPPHRLRRGRADAVLGGVCAGIARSAGLDPLLLRIAVVAVTVLTGGAGVPAYLVAWVLIPREPLVAAAPPADADRLGPPLHAVGSSAAGTAGGTGADVRSDWTAVGNDLRSLTTELRRPAAGTGPTAGGTTVGSPTGTGMPDDPAHDRTEHDLTASDGTAPEGEATADADGPAAEPAAGAVPAPRSPLAAADDAATGADRPGRMDAEPAGLDAARSAEQAMG